MVVVLVLAVGFVMTREDKEMMSEKGESPEAITDGTNTEQSDKATTKETKSDAGVSVSDHKTLDLSNQGLEKVPDYVISDTGIEVLDVSGNALGGSLQAEVRHLQNLKVLDLSDNQFTGVPAEVGQLKNLEVLNLSNNQLTGLPYELGTLSKLKVLNLKGNAYSSADLNIIEQGLPDTVTIEID